MSPFEHGEVFVLDDGGEVGMNIFSNLLSKRDQTIINNWCSGKHLFLLIHRIGSLQLHVFHLEGKKSLKKEIYKFSVTFK